MHTEFAEKQLQTVALGFKIQRSAIVIADAFLPIPFDTTEICTDTDSTKYSVIPVSKFMHGE